MIQDLIQRNRSYRRFDQKISIDKETLKGFINLARLSASLANRQPLKYVIINDAGRNEQVFACLGWAGYLSDWHGAVEGERPTAYIVLLGDTQISTNFAVDEGIACQSILLGATEHGYGGCIIATIKKEKLREILHIPEAYEILLVVALGKPVETVQIEEINAEGDIKYWRDANQVHHVPKRALKDIILDL